MKDEGWGGIRDERRGRAEGGVGMGCLEMVVDEHAVEREIQDVP